MRTALIVFIFITLANFTQADEGCLVKDKNRMYDVSIIHLITNPDFYDGAFVRIKGVASTDIDRQRVYLSKESFENFIRSNSVGIKFHSDIFKKHPDILPIIHGTYQIIEGTFYQTSSTGGYVANVCRISAYYSGVAK
ncbi:MAG: hypothetical protein HWE13_12095 [Gammaproteobacteria bacterium]|nr:hypothetical protein [Gammaproteobacteria bacterium]